MNAIRDSLAKGLAPFGRKSPAAPIRGSGSRPCSAFAAAFAGGDALAFQQQYQWFLGFVSSYNHYVMRHQPGMPPDGAFHADDDELLYRLTEYCRLNPEHDFYWAAQSLILERTAGA